ncbi:MAG TPA: thermonuclease family protein [Rhizomicrobium sp.]|jgi:endonuclease YncB( thermonuclease family)|nr:thermonuclease family protein [Rhizomicrobium sp.]
MAPPIAILCGTAASLVILLASALNPASDLAPAAWRVEAAGFDGPVSAHVTRVIDGDTFEAAAIIWLGEAINVRVRIEGIDAPELHARCPQELTRAQAARDYLARRIEGGDVRLKQVHYDKYGGRVDATVEDEKGDIGEAMVRANLARPYEGGHRGGWCDA